MPTCRDVCGFPQTVHGGLTAAIMDETLGGLGICMWQSGALGFRPPAYTARLEVNYKRVSLDEAIHAQSLIILWLAELQDTCSINTCKSLLFQMMLNMLSLCRKFLLAL
jgi:hypothetical protein